MTLDCAQELTERWIKSKDDPDTLLRGSEVDLIEKVLKMGTPDIAGDIRRIMTSHDLDDFLQVRAQIRSIDRF